MEIRVLGPLEAVNDHGEVLPLGPLKRRTVLGVLASDPARTVSKDRLIDALWETPPESASATLQGLIYQLRQLLGNGVIVSQPPGYRLADVVDLDLHRFETLAGRGGIDDLDEAIGLFRGRVLDDLGDTDDLESFRRRWADARVNTVERWCDLALDAGRPSEVAARCERELLTNPWREALWERLMLALYRANRQADALQAFVRARHVLSEDLGLEPGMALRSLEQQILLHDPELSDARSGQRGPATLAISTGPPLPTGEVALLLTDLVGSTGLWERSPTAMNVAVARHEEILRVVVTDHDGIVLKARGEGDSTFSVFTDATAAVAAALAAQRCLMSEPWERECVLSVRMAVHVGEVIERNGDYFGPTVNRAARLRSIARGQEILLSRAVVDASRDRLPPDATVVDLGMRPLRDVDEHVFVVRHPSLPVYADTVTSAPGQRTQRPTAGDGAVRAFVGRSGELAHLRRRIADPGSRGSVSMVIGEPGIGKTRLVSELSDHATSHGFAVMWGSSPDGEWAYPYAPLVEALERFLASLEPDEARRLLGSVAQPLVNVLPIVGELLPSVPADGSLDAEQRRFEILDALRRLLDAVTGSQPVLLVLDDLHWIDQASASALSFLMRVTTRSPLHVVGTYRDSEVDDSHPLAVALASAQREVRVDRIKLRGFTAAAAGELVQQLSPVTLTDEELTELVSSTGGNPFFLGELVRFRAEDSVSGIPDSVQDSIRQRLGRLRSETNAMLRIGALFDERFPLVATRLVADIEEDAALDALDEAIAAHLIEPADDVDEFRFVHALARVAVRSTINPSRLPRLHRRLAVTLEEQLGDLGEMPTLARIAAHFHASRSLPGAERGIAPALTAAAHADAVTAHDVRADLLSIALDLMSPTDDRRPRTTGNLAIALIRAARPEDGSPLVVAAADQLLDAEGAGAALEFVATVVDETSLTVNFPPLETFLAWAELGVAVGDGAVGDEAADARRFLAIWAQTTRMTLLGEDRFRERAALLEDPEFQKICVEVLRIGAPRLGWMTLHAGTQTRQDQLAFGEASANVGRIEDAAMLAVREIEGFRPFDQPGSRSSRHGRAARAFALLGRLDDSRQHAELSRSVLPAPLEVGLVRGWAVAEFLLTTINGGPWDGFFDRMASLASVRPDTTHLWQLATQGVGNPSVVAIAAVGRARTGDGTAAARMTGSLVDYVAGASVREPFYSFVAHRAVETAWAVNQPALVASLEPPIRERWLPADFRAEGADVRWSLARLCALDGRLTEATWWFAQARVVLREDGARPLLALVDHDEALMHVRHPGHLESAAVVRLLDRALAEFERIGMTGWITESSAVRAALIDVG